MGGGHRMFVRPQNRIDSTIGHKHGGQIIRRDVGLGLSPPKRPCRMWKMVARGWRNRSCVDFKRQILAGRMPCLIPLACGCSKTKKFATAAWAAAKTRQNCKSRLPIRTCLISRIRSTAKPQSRKSLVLSLKGLGPCPSISLLRRLTDQVSQGGPATTIKRKPSAAQDNQNFWTESCIRSQDASRTTSILIGHNMPAGGVGMLATVLCRSLVLRTPEKRWRTYNMREDRLGEGVKSTYIRSSLRSIHSASSFAASWVKGFSSAGK